MGVGGGRGGWWLGGDGDACWTPCLVPYNRVSYAQNLGFPSNVLGGHFPFLWKSFSFDTHRGFSIHCQLPGN